MLKNQNPTQTAAWKKINTHFQGIKGLSIKSLFDKNPHRASQFSLAWEDFYVDFSKNIITEEALEALYDLAKEAGLEGAREAYFSGQPINRTESRAVLHTALRADTSEDIRVDSQNIVPEIAAVKAKIKSFTEEVVSGSRKGYSGKPFTDVVNIGIGGSDLGPNMVVEALKFYANHLKLHFVNNVDGDHIAETLKNLNAETTLFIVVSKTFTTQETLSNATTARQWFLKRGTAQDVSKHFVAVSSNLEQVSDFGISPENVFPMWDWVGGRFSLWSAVGLSISLAVGYENYERLLAGAASMDRHFRTAPPERNIPVTLALLSIWYNNFFGAESQAIIPYSQYLHRLSAYLQQAIMESNGKSIDRNGQIVAYQTGNIIWGEPGTNSQHAYFQLLHQGTKLIPADFIGFKESLHGNRDHHDKLMSNFFAQTEALMCGKTEQQAVEDLQKKGLSDEAARALAVYKKFDGNKPTNTILIEKLTPYNLGALIAMYEHVVFVQGIVWNIYSYDQWGVELGKELAGTILRDIAGAVTPHDPSTTELLKQYKKKPF